MDRWIQGALPPVLNPFTQLGAIANLCLLIAVASGIALLLWYTPSVHQAYDSLAKIESGSVAGQWMRSIHRYSSDGCVFFILLHAFRIVTQRRFTGPRWLAWTTGILMLALLWFIGWTGYWLVWDVRAQHAALGSARFMDSLPVFAEPLSRSFLTDQSVHSLLFFLIFFIHMLAPLGLGVGLWMHLMRVNRSKFFPGRVMTSWVFGSLVVVSALIPALSAEPAKMTVKAQQFTMDWWYLWPLVLTDRLGGGMLWAIFLGGGAVVLSVPWWMAGRRRRLDWAAQVELSRCMGCTLCAQDCPFNAITMVAREDGRKFPVQSQIDPALCVGCGICTGSCDSQAINMPRFNSREIEKRTEAWIRTQRDMEKPAWIGFYCGESAGAALGIDAGGMCGEFPEYRFERVPCVGWVSAVLLERLVQRGATGVLVIGCGEGDPVGREGMRWFGQRLRGEREPAFDPKKADLSRIRFVQFDRTRVGDLRRAAEEFRQVGKDVGATAPARSGARQVRRGMGLALVLSAVTYAFSNLPYRTAHSPEPELVVSFNHSGAIREPRKLTAEELSKRLPHMRAQVNVTRERAPVRLRVQVDGRTVLDRSYAPKGISNDGPSMAVARLAVSPGDHQVRVEMADTADPENWTLRWSEVVSFATNQVRVVLFDTKTGFTLAPVPR